MWKERVKFWFYANKKFRLSDQRGKDDVEGSHIVPEFQDRGMSHLLNHYSTAMAAFLLLTIAHHRRLYARGLIDFEEDEDEEIVDGVARPLGPPSTGRFATKAMILAADCKAEFRFSGPHLKRLLGILQVPNWIQTKHRDKVSSLKVLCLCLYCLSYPAHLDRMAEEFAMSKSAISRVITAFIRRVTTSWDRLLYWDEHRLTPSKLEELADIVADNNGYLCSRVFGFIDGTTRQICRPTRFQWSMYNGHKKHHCVKYQGVVTPDGIIIHIGDCFEGNTHDHEIYRRSGLEEVLRVHAKNTDNENLALFGDAAYQVSGHMLKAISGVDLSAADIRFNKALNAQRTSAEHAFGKVTNIFSALSFSRVQKILATCVADQYRFAVLLTNAHTCLYGSQMTTSFDTNAPTLEQYFSPGIFQFYIDAE